MEFVLGKLISLPHSANFIDAINELYINRNISKF